MDIRRVRAILEVACVLGVAGAGSAVTQVGQALAAGPAPFHPVPG
jgi:hypothetical protein